MSYTLDIEELQILRCVRMNYFEAHLMASSRGEDSKVSKI